MIEVFIPSTVSSVLKWKPVFDFGLLALGLLTLIKFFDRILLIIDRYPMHRIRLSIKNAFHKEPEIDEHHQKQLFQG
tara:strand:+ start:1286 stop:1516 length:231 start_codon:yes stop_codon:yes gene_type:complete